jgi:hypothetical protein
MINIFVSLFLIVVLTWVFLWVFVPKRERVRPAMNFVSGSDAVISLVESHDGRSIGFITRLAIARVERSRLGEGYGIVFALRTVEKFLEGRR